MYVVDQCVSVIICTDHVSLLLLTLILFSKSKQIVESLREMQVHSIIVSKWKYIMIPKVNNKNKRIIFVSTFSFRL